MAARRLLKRKKWIRGYIAFIRGQDPMMIYEEELLACQDEQLIGVCAVGAVVRASGSDKVARFSDVLERALVLRSPTFFPELTSWNDTEAKSKRDVIKLFDEAIALTKKKAK